jgi:hypothetical protein
LALKNLWQKLANSHLSLDDDPEQIVWEKEMYNVLYGSKSLVIYHETAADLARQAHVAKESLDDELASQLIKLAVKVEQGTLEAGEALNLAKPLAVAA